MHNKIPGVIRMTYEAIEAEFLDCVDKGIVTIIYDSKFIYTCTCSCHGAKFLPACPLSDHDDRWCKHGGEHYKNLLAKVYQTRPELFI